MSWWLLPPQQEVNMEWLYHRRGRGRGEHQLLLFLSLSGSGSRQLQSGGVGCTPSCSLRQTTDADEVTPPTPPGGLRCQTQP